MRGWHAGRSAPPLVLLGLDNSRARGRPKQPLTRVAFFSSYWIDNRTGMDLMFQDHAAAHANPFLLGARMPGAYAEVLVPGMPSWGLDNKKTVMFDSRHHTCACGLHAIAKSQVGGDVAEWHLPAWDGS